jgi:hypothetical protein
MTTIDAVRLGIVQQRRMLAPLSALEFMHSETLPRYEISTRVMK